MDNKAYQLFKTLHRLGRQLRRAQYNQNTLPQEKQSHLLLLIAQNTGIIQRDLAMLLDIRPSSMTETLVKLENLGLIFREQDKKDQRIMHIFLTELGKNTIQKSHEQSISNTNELFGCLNIEEIEEMLTISQKLSEHLSSIECICNKPHCQHRHMHKCGHHNYKSAKTSINKDTKNYNETNSN